MLNVVHAYDRETEIFRCRKTVILHPVIIPPNILLCFLLVFLFVYAYLLHFLLNFSLLCSGMPYMQVCILLFHLERKHFFLLS